MMIYDTSTVPSTANTSPSNAPQQTWFSNITINTNADCLNFLNFELQKVQLET